MIAKSNEKGFLANLSSAQVSDRAELIMVDCRVELVYTPDTSNRQKNNENSSS